MYKEIDLPSELQKALDSDEFDYEAGIRIDAMSFKDQILSLTIAFLEYGNSPFQIWEIKIEDPKDENIVIEWANNIHIYSSHPLLLEFKDSYAELYFTGTTEKALELQSQIFQSLYELSGNISYIEQYLFTPYKIEKLSQQGHGLFARGPRLILEVYEKALIDCGMKPKFIGDWPKSSEGQNLKLLKIGSSHVVAESFEFLRIS